MIIDGAFEELSGADVHQRFRVTLVEGTELFRSGGHRWLQVYKKVWSYS